MLQIATLSTLSEPHPLQEHLHQQLVEHGFSIVAPPQAEVLICMGSDIQGFDATAIAQIEAQIVERFLGAELFLLARAFPFARIRVGLNPQNKLLIATPLDESTLFRLIRLLEQFQRLNKADFEQTMGGFRNLPSVEDAEQSYTTEQTEETPSTQSLQTTPHTPVTTPLENATQSWMDKVEHWQLRPCEHSFPVPPELAHAGIQQVLKSTTQFQTRQDPMGNLYGLFGFPDLIRPQSRVLLVTPDGGVIAVHRKQSTCILTPMAEDLLFSLKAPFPKWATELLDSKMNGANKFALEGSRVYGKSGLTVLSATAQQGPKDEGRSNSAAASLLLQWSSR